MPCLDVDDQRNCPPEERGAGPAGEPSPLIAVAVLAAALSVLVVLWSRARPFSGRIVNTPAVLGASSSLAGLAGTVLLSATIVLSARLRFLEATVGGLDRVYRLHHWLGGVAFSLVALHPCLLAWRYAQVSWWRAAHLWLPAASDVALTAGQVALWGMVAAMVVTVFVAVRHQVLVWMQRILGLLFLPAAYHVFRIGGDVGRYRPLRVYMAVVVAAGLAALVYHTLLGRLLVRSYAYRLASVEPLAGGVTDVRLDPAGRALPFVAGQFGFLRFRHDPIGAEPHPFSMASPPGRRELRFVIKDLGDYTSHLGSVRPGAEAEVEGPYGRFSHRFVRGRNQVWVAGGIGIAPFLAMAGELGEWGLCVDLYYCVVDAERAPFLDELAALEAANPTLRLRIVEERVEGFLTAAEIARRSGRLDGREFLLCGPPAMMHALRDQLHARGVPRGRIHYEEFGFG